MGATAEVRWFWPGSPPADFQRWFASAGPRWPEAHEAEDRIDEYLRDPGQAELGIKRRAGARVEIKGLVASRSAVVEFAGCRACVEFWSKWTSASLDLSGSRLIPLEKRRWLRLFQTGEAVPTEVPPEQDSARPSGCNAEITAVVAPDGSPWWTVGFEAFGELDSLEAALVGTLAVMAARNPPMLPEAEAMSYPAWLADKGW
jgi:hypothetical protein